MWISDDIKDNIIEYDCWIKEGTIVGGFTAANEAIGTLILKFKNEEKLQEVLANQNKYIKIKLT